MFIRDRSYDHRIIDGREAVQFLVTFKAYIQRHIRIEAGRKNANIVTTWAESGLLESDKNKEDIKPWRLVNFRAIAGTLHAKFDQIEEKK